MHAQELPGLPSRLLDAEDGTRTTLQRARDHLGAGAPDYLTDDGDTLFIRLVMLRQLQRAYGRDLFRAVNRHFRAAPAAVRRRRSGLGSMPLCWRSAT